MKCLKMKNNIGINGAILKTIALISMTLDHIAGILIPEDTVYYYIFRGIGRIAFPIFCFLLAEGMYYTKNRCSYLMRISLLAMISQIIYSYGFDNLNVLFTFTLGILLIMISDRIDCIYIKNKIFTICLNVFLKISVLFVICYLAEEINADYAEIGIINIYAGYFFIKKSKKEESFNLAKLSSPIICCFDIFQLPAISAIIPLMLYSGDKGKQNKKFFYIYYPVHLAILFIIKQLLL